MSNQGINPESVLAWTPNLSKIVSGLISNGYLTGTMDLCISVENEEQLKQVKAQLNNCVSLHLIVTYPDNPIISEEITRFEMNL